MLGRIRKLTIPVKYIHLIVATFYLIYTLINITRLGVGELSSIGVCIATLLIAWFGFKKDLTGMYLAGMILGIAVEYLTEVYWDYSFNVFIWRDISLYVVLGWGYSFSIFVLISNWLYTRFLSRKETLVATKRILFIDALLAPVWFIIHEFIGMNILHLWTYTQAAQWTHIIPVFNYPWEGVIGAILFGTILPTFVRYWDKELSISGKGFYTEKSSL